MRSQFSNRLNHFHLFVLLLVSQSEAQQFKIEFYRNWPEALEPIYWMFARLISSLLKNCWKVYTTFPHNIKLTWPCRYLLELKLPKVLLFNICPYKNKFPNFRFSIWWWHKIEIFKKKCDNILWNSKYKYYLFLIFSFIVFKDT